MPYEGVGVSMAHSMYGSEHGDKFHVCGDASVSDDLFPFGDGAAVLFLDCRKVRCWTLNVYEPRTTTIEEGKTQPNADPHRPTGTGPPVNQEPDLSMAMS